MPIVLVLEGRVLPGQQQALEAFLRHARPYYESIGDVEMSFLWHADDPHRFREVFTYATRQAFELDDKRVTTDAVMHGYLQRWRALLDGNVSVSVWHQPEL